MHVLKQLKIILFGEADRKTFIVNQLKICVNRYKFCFSNEPIYTFISLNLTDFEACVFNPE